MVALYRDESVFKIFGRKRMYSNNEINAICWCVKRKRISTQLKSYYGNRASVPWVLFLILSYRLRNIMNRYTTHATCKQTNPVKRERYGCTCNTFINTYFLVANLKMPNFYQFISGTKFFMMKF